MTIEYGYCGTLRRSTSAGSNSTFEDVCNVVELSFPNAIREPIDLTDSGLCADGGYGKNMPSPLRMLEDVEFTINYEADKPGHKLILDDYHAEHTPETAHYWQWVDRYGNEVWECKSWVATFQNVAAQDTALQATFTLHFTGKPTWFAKKAVA